MPLSPRTCALAQAPHSTRCGYLLSVPVPQSVSHFLSCCNFNLTLPIPMQAWRWGGLSRWGATWTPTAHSRSHGYTATHWYEDGRSSSTCTTSYPSAPTVSHAAGFVRPHYMVSSDRTWQQNHFTQRGVAARGHPATLPSPVKTLSPPPHRSQSTSTLAFAAVRPGYGLACS